MQRELLRRAGECGRGKSYIDVISKQRDAGGICDRCRGNFVDTLYASPAPNGTRRRRTRWSVKNLHFSTHPHSQQY